MFLRILFLGLIFLNFEVWSANSKEIKDLAQIPSLNPEFKERQKAKILLENGLQAYIISDPLTKQSAAVMSVRTGSFADPDEYPGIAHFLEHMLFLGTKKYPKESEFDRYLSEHGGMSNAFTGGDFTSYLFAVNNEGFVEALDRFASFFKEPLFNPSGVGRELNAIDQEFSQNLNVEERRQLQVFKELGNPNHPFHRFDIGNTSTLSSVKEQDLREWFLNHYSANIMRLFIYSPLPLAELKDLVIQDFSKIPNRNLSPLHFDTSLLRKDLNGHLIYIEPNQNIRTLNILFELPSKFAHMDTKKPADIICYVLGHEAEGSLLTELKNEHLAEELVCDGTQIGNDNMIFQIEVRLTAKGLDEVDTVIKRVFQAIHNLSDHPIPQYIFDEVQKIYLMRYQYMPRENVFEMAAKQGLWMPREDLSTYPELTLTLKEKDPQAVKELLSYLTPENALYALSAPSEALGINFDQKEKWMGVNYSVKKMPEEKLKVFREAAPIASITFPEANPFIPKKFSVHSVPLIKGDFLSLPHPKTLIDDSAMLAYYAPDQVYNSPKAFLRFTIKSPAMNSGKADAMAMTDLYIKALEDLLDPIIYNAKMAELEFNVYNKPEGLQITIEGYSESIFPFIEEIQDKLAFREVSSEKFAIYKDILSREYENFLKDFPIKQAFDILKGAFYERYVTNAKRLETLSAIDEEKFLGFLRKIFAKNYIEGLLIGNLTENEALNLAHNFQKGLGGKPYPKSEQIPIEVIELSNNVGPFFIQEKTKAQGNAALLAIEADKFSTDGRNCQQMLFQALQEAFFTELRTKQQTGYTVFTSGEDLERHLVSLFGVQSNSHDPEELLYRFELFIEGYLRNLRQSEITPERFVLLKDWLMLQLKEMPKNLSELGEKWNLLAFSYKNFDWTRHRVEALGQLTYEQFIAFSEQFLGRSNKRRLGVLIYGEVPEQGQFRYSPLKLGRAKSKSAVRLLKAA